MYVQARFYRRHSSRLTQHAATRDSVPRGSHPQRLACRATCARRGTCATLLAAMHRSHNKSRLAPSPMPRPNICRRRSHCCSALMPLLSSLSQPRSSRWAAAPLSLQRSRHCNTSLQPSTASDPPTIAAEHCSASHLWWTADHCSASEMRVDRRSLAASLSSPAGGEEEARRRRGGGGEEEASSKK